MGMPRDRFRLRSLVIDKKLASPAKRGGSSLSHQSADAGVYLGVPSGATEEVIVAAPARRHVPLVAGGKAPAQTVRCVGLPAAGNGVVFAFNGQ